MRKFSRSSHPASGARADTLLHDGERANRDGRHREAAALLIGAIEADPGVAACHYELGRAMSALDEPARAVTCYRKAIELDPAMHDAHADLAATLLMLGQSGPAAASARAALALDPASQAALANLGTACLRLGEIDEARRCSEQALRLAPQSFEAMVQHGNVLMEMRQPESASQSYREALRLRPRSVTAHCSVGFTHDIQGELDQALSWYEKALALEPENVQAHLNRSAIHLLREDFAGGWDEYEWRLRDPAQAALHGHFPQPRWDGAPLAGRRILVYREQGLGDQIMAASCLPEVIAQAGHCVIDCDPRLAVLFRRSFPQATVRGDDDATTERVDVAVSMASLPRFLRRSATAFPRHEGYLRAAPERVAAWRERLRAAGRGRAIGISWRGGVPQTNRGARSLALADLLPVLKQEGAAFVSLQYGQSTQELEEIERQHGVRVHHWPEAIDDYDETAALVTALDLTVSVCTAVVHLAGALGRPAWVMAPVRAEPRYGLKGESMRWYPSVRMFRQAHYGEWSPVVTELAAALRETS